MGVDQTPGNPSSLHYPSLAGCHSTSLVATGAGPPTLASEGLPTVSHCEHLMNTTVQMLLQSSSRNSQAPECNLTQETAFHLQSCSSKGQGEEVIIRITHSSNSLSLQLGAKCSSQPWLHIRITWGDLYTKGGGAGPSKSESLRLGCGHQPGLRPGKGAGTS